MAELGAVVAEVRRQRPLVHCLTAAVTMNFVADALLAAGARPMMTETIDEAPTLVTVADALLVNLGTLSVDGAVGIPVTAEVAADRGTPWVLDPVAIGLAPVRTPLARELVRLGPGIIKGNASEVLALAGSGAGGSGPDATDPVTAAERAAALLAERHRSVVAVTGARDLVTDGHRSGTLDRGHPWLARVTGTGCALGGLMAACLAVAEPWPATLAALSWLTIAAEDAAERSRGPGTFKIALLDELAALEPEELDERVGLR
ncbi:hydroxyethylthiazole kinase [Enemella evansiae]|uniref:Hydroxyethylthiazole kinase n=1 Tax=Enemella evansiae TaxID=2016499 RepID=A0A255GAI4_9ACTN|nr:hydroxyethylthiazole kinase [Enemella evansiae]OYO10996.1 hydroxyethylthiazole kinase [Enemella evansiae]OYO12937.1 hydroxyethylthiazole kinase [Enemella evansiae]